MNHSPTKWICHPMDNRQTRLVPVFRRVFEVKKGLKKAALSLTAHGVYEAEINGQPVTTDKFTPGLTSYYYRIQVQTYDVTALLREGGNLWQTTVGDGWWRWNNNFGPRLALWGELRLDYENETVFVGTDESFMVGTGPILKSDLQQGESYDARLEPHGFVSAEAESFHTDAKRILQEGVPVREKERFPGKLLKDSAGGTVIDFGQNLAGYIHMRLRNTKRGQLVRLKHGEALDPEGKFSTANCDGGMEPFQEIRYICRGAEYEEYTPHFAVFGFRYALLEGAEDGEFEAIAVYSDMEETGDFQCSNPLINQLVKNARWSQKGNFLDVPTDCPTRERNAWTGDAMIYCRTSAYFMDVRKFYRKWLKDQTLEQYASGKVGITFPSTSSVHDPEELRRVREKNPMLALAGPTGDGFPGEDSVGWGDSAVWIPWQMYLMYGDREFLVNQYDTAKKYLDYSLRCMQESNPYYSDMPWYNDLDGKWIYDTHFHYGEWKEPLPSAPEIIELFANGGTGADYVQLKKKLGAPEVATAYTKRSCDNLADMAEALGNAGDAAVYRALSEKIKAAYDKFMIALDGTIQPGHQAPYIRALALDLVSEQKKPFVIARLRKEIEAADYHLNTGFLSTVYLLPTLCDNGLADEAFRILEQTSAPGWLHQIILGATTILEDWDGMDKYQDSFNHYSFGAVCQFLFEYVAGIRPTVGFKHFLLRPLIGGSLTWAEGKYKGIKSRWERNGEEYLYTCTIPTGATARLTLPDGRKETLSAGNYRFEGEYHG